LFPKSDAAIQRALRQPELAARSLTILLIEATKIPDGVVAIPEIDGAARISVVRGGSGILGWGAGRVPD